MPKKEHACPKGFLAANRAGIYNKSAAASVHRGRLTCAAFQGKAAEGLRHLRDCVPIIPAPLYKEVPGSFL